MLVYIGFSKDKHFIPLLEARKYKQQCFVYVSSFISTII